ncbi:MAG: transglutaminase family protein [Rhizobiaceae bacterium]
MRIRISHTTTHSYEQPTRYGIQELRISPAPTRSQKILEWHIECPGIDGAATYHDGSGNLVHLVNQIGETSGFEVQVTGLVETSNADGIIGVLSHGPAPRLFVRETALTKPNAAIIDLAERHRGRHRDQIALYHALMSDIRAAMKFDTQATHVHTTAAEAYGQGHGVCQDFAHVFITACRLLDQPARYVTGYLVHDAESEAHHAWAEAEVAGLGWVAFDPANGLCPDENYVRLACGFDAATAAPIRGIRRGPGGEEMQVRVSVRQLDTT